MFLELVIILKCLFAALINTCEDSRRVCVVFRHMQLVRKVCFEILAAQQTCVQNGGVHAFLVLL
jgi:hypothetical protein